MELPAVSVQNVSKKFRLFNSPKERLLEILHPFKKRYHREFWALKDISFDAPKGKTIGIIGRNGSGKSTLLQIICSVLRPTSGVVVTDGRISPLLALGAGFNPEFTGRDNVLMNGALMGFSAEKMKGRLPVIEAFADIGEFIDQPVKIYSSGMFVRLAFAAAINVNPDILVIDEVLAVGDAKFQHKCYQKFLEFQEAGKTIIFVTHDTGAIVRHCDRAVLLEKGQVVGSGYPNDIVNKYYKIMQMEEVDDFEEDSLSKDSAMLGSKGITVAIDSKTVMLEEFFEEIPVGDRCTDRKTYNDNEYRYGDRRAEIVDYLIVCQGACDPIAIDSGDTIDVYLKVQVYKDIQSPTFGFVIKTLDGIPVYGNNTRYMEISLSSMKSLHTIVFKFSVKLDLKAGDYFISIGIGEKCLAKDDAVDARWDVIRIIVKEKEYFEGITRLETSFQEIYRKKIESLAETDG